MTPNIPQLPSELFERIIATTWHMPLSSPERITFMRSSILVNSTWADIFDLVSSRDVYIPSSAFCDHFLQRLRAPPPTTPPPSLLARFVSVFDSRPPRRAIQPRDPNLACQSLTIQLANPDVHPPIKGRPTRLPMGAVLDDLLEMLDARDSLVPNLRRLCIEYLDAGFDDVFHRTGLAALPPQITRLELRYSYSPETPLWLVEALRAKQTRQRSIRWIAPEVTELEVVGGGARTVRDLLRACPNVQKLET